MPSRPSAAIKRFIRLRPLATEVILGAPVVAMLAAAPTGWAFLAVGAAFALGVANMTVDCQRRHGDR